MTKASARSTDGGHASSPSATSTFRAARARRAGRAAGAPSARAARSAQTRASRAAKRVRVGPRQIIHGIALPAGLHEGVHLGVIGQRDGRDAGGGGENQSVQAHPDHQVTGGDVRQQRRQPFLRRTQRRPVPCCLLDAICAANCSATGVSRRRLHRQQQRAPPAQDRRAGVGDLRGESFLPLPGPQGDAERAAPLPAAWQCGRCQQQGRVGRHFDGRARDADLAQQRRRVRVAHRHGVQPVGDGRDQAARAGQLQRADALGDEHGLLAQHLRHPDDAQIVKDAVRRSHVLQQAAAAGQKQVGARDRAQQRGRLVAVGGADAVRRPRLGRVARTERRSPVRRRAGRPGSLPPDPPARPRPRHCRSRNSRTAVRRFTAPPFVRRRRARRRRPRPARRRPRPAPSRSARAGRKSAAACAGGRTCPSATTARWRR